jgi:hypothetical protein
MFVLFEGLRRLGTIFFGISIITMTISLVISLWEVQLSVGALKLHLKDIEESAEEKAFKVF